MANLDTRSKRASSVQLLNACLAPPLPDGTIGQGDRQHIAWVYSGLIEIVASIMNGPNLNPRNQSIFATLNKGVM